QIQRLENFTLEQAKRIVRQCAQNAWQIVTPDGEDYPPLLLRLNNFPAVLYTWGDLSCLKDKVSIAVVGSRSASPYSIDVAGRLSASLSRSGAVVVSGGALGVDSAAHTGALYGGGKTVAVLGCGLGARYLMGNHALRTQIAQSGAVISEYPPDTQAIGSNFPIRNRLISGLSYGTVVIEAGVKSGSLITAGYALEQGRDIFAVPGDIINSSYTGTNKLIRDGAKPVFSGADVLEEYAFRYPGALSFDALESSLAEAPSKPGGFGHSKNMPTNKTRVQVQAGPQKADMADFLRRKSAFKKARRTLPESLDASTHLVYSKILNEPIHIDDIVRAVKLEPAKVITALTELEVYGFIELTSGKRYVLM
ncbi:MAG TPA: DNA-processing protein DprA, partial [Clostridia bacterium]|nr:DNA-processing protein DprA [Clostridia bacterium]